MSLDNLGQTPWVEIHLPASPPPTLSWWLLWLSLIILAAVLIWAGCVAYRRSAWRQRMQLRRLRRQLTQKRMGPREALYDLARLAAGMDLDGDIQLGMQARFAREEPGREETLRLLTRLERGLCVW
ncbi:MAG: hypothetical protein HUJ29_13665 [Gammaproteobacteria bacterium]|nr:hypothetical protein [Gammaproteobacteria bacterium]